MAVRIRLARRGRKKRAMYDVVVADARAPRDGRFIEKIGIYNPNTNPATVDINADKAFDWVMKGAQPSDTVAAMLKYRGVLMRKHLQIGVNKGAISQEEADKRLADWIEAKESKIQGKTDRLASERDAAAKARLEAETKVKEARAEAIRKRQEEANAALNAAEAPAADAEGEAEATEETPAE
ncbi:MAG: 30S ribosomal protein S16 [Bacteroidetes bacterium]|nr:30S ribosomal protein S16 [Bacteroidota bacterium]